nr:anti-sigma factor [Chitinophaga varians]
MQLLNRLHDEFSTPVHTVPVIHRYREVVFKYAAVLALCLLAVSGLLNIYLYSRYRQANRDFTRLQSQHDMMAADNRAYQARFAIIEHELQVITAPGTRRISLSGVAGREQRLVTLYWDTHTKDVYLIANDLPVPPEGKQYQLWALVGGKPVPAGLLDEKCSGLCAAEPVQQAEAFAITLEKKGGSVTPTMDQMFVLGKVNI